MSDDQYLRHEGGSQGEPEPREAKDQARKARCESAAWCKQSSKEGHYGEKEAHEVEDPAEPPHIVVVLAGSILSVRATLSQYCATPQLEAEHTQ